MPRSIYLAIYSNGAKPAHVAVFIPTGDQGLKGKIIHVTGNPATGFFLQFKRNYNFETETRKYRIILLAQVEHDQLIKDTPESGDETEDTIARDRLESVATVVQPPGPSRNPFDPLALNCQNWMQTYIHQLVEEAYIPGSAIGIFTEAPKKL